jgi:molybdenum cofactor cytidylyltransferase
MGRPKLLLPWQGRLVIEQVIAALRAAGIARLLVVVSPDLPELARVASAAGAATFLLAAPTADMRATVEAGLAWIEQTWSPRDEAGWLLVPADHPVLDPSVVRQLLEAWQSQPDRTIFVPTHAGRRGHPTLLAWSEVAALRASPLGEGLNRFIRSRPERTAEVPVDSDLILADLDTPEDYARLLALAAGRRPLAAGGSAGP